jgi:hypothetical protein
MLRLQKCLRFVSAETLLEADARGLLSVDGDRWRLGDQSNGATRGLNPRSKFKRCDNKGEKWHQLIGLQDVIESGRRFVIFVIEGAKDAMAALELAHRAGLLPEVGVVAALGAGYRPIQSEIAQLRRIKVLLVGDRDRAGTEAVRRISKALAENGVDHVVLNWNGIPRDAGKDLFDLLVAIDRDENFAGALPAQLLSFFLPFPSYGSTVQQFNSSTHKIARTDLSSSTHILTFVEPFVVTKQSTGNRKSFELARAVRMHEETSGVFLGNEEIDETFHRWFAESRPFLKPDADEQKSCAHFYMQMRRVRYLASDLDAACDRARTLSPPQIPGLDAVALKVAALMRELQGNAGDKSFIAPINVVARFADLTHPEQARRILFVLERRGVIECVVRGTPHLSGRPGKSTIWRYSLIEGVA